MTVEKYFDEKMTLPHIKAASNPGSRTSKQSNGYFYNMLVGYRGTTVVNTLAVNYTEGIGLKITFPFITISRPYCEHFCSY